MVDATKAPMSNTTLHVSSTFCSQSQLFFGLLTIIDYMDTKVCFYVNFILYLHRPPDTKPSLMSEFTVLWVVGIISDADFVSVL